MTQFDPQFDDSRFGFQSDSQSEQTNLSGDALTLLRKVGVGRYIEEGNFSLSLDYQPISPGPRLCLHAKVNQYALCLWMEERQWLEWIELVLPLRSFERVPRELLPILTEWTVASLNRWLQSIELPNLEVSGIDRGECKATYAWVLTIGQKGCQLRLFLTTPPLNWLLDLADRLEVDTYFSTPYTIPVSLIAGWVRLSIAELRGLKSGEGIVLECASSVNIGQAWLYLSCPVAKLVFEEPGSCRVEEIMEEFDDWMDVDQPEAGATEETPVEPIHSADSTGGVSLDSLTFQVVAEIGRIEMSISDLAVLAPGQILEAVSRFDQNIKLKINGKTIATGSLLQIEDQLVVRIEKLGHIYTH